MFLCLSLCACACASGLQKSRGESLFSLRKKEKRKEKYVTEKGQARSRKSLQCGCFKQKKGDIDCLRGWFGSLQADKEFAALMFLFCFVR